MSMFDPINTAMTGVNVSETWISAISDNLSNMNDVTSTSNGAYQTRYVVAGAVPTGTGASPIGATGEEVGQGTQVEGIALGSPAGAEVSDPGSPLADKNGMVRSADVDLGQQMTDMMLAQRGYEANLATISQAENAYQAALGLTV